MANIAYYDSPIGIIEVTEDEGFITSVYARDEEHKDTLPDSPVLAMAVAQLDEYFAGKRLNFDLPIKQAGSDFQQTVWKQLLKIDFGKTISYGQQSKLMNNPLGIRAIASANGKNNLLIVVPCHRVIGSDGSLTGFGAGVWRKKWLLEHEARVLCVGQTSLF
jgi:methylated-DNA-[protein]-cysteine S-methyltransferase